MSQEDPDLITIQSVDEFAAYIAHWHNNRVTQLQMAMKAPADVEIQFSPGEGEPEVTMNADHRAGFHAGLALAMSLFGTMPFDAIPVDETEVLPEAPANDPT